MKITGYASKIVLVVATAFLITGCFTPEPGEGFRTFGTQPYPDDLDNPAGNAH